MQYKVRALIGEYAITLEDGQTVYDLIHPRLAAGEEVELDFEGVEIFASPFFNAAIGQLLRDLTSDQLNALLRIQNLDPDRLRVLRRVIQNSKRYYADEAERRAVDDVLAEEARRS